MEFDGFSITDYITKSVVIVPIVLGLTQAIKMTAIPERYSAIIAIVVGIMIAFVTGSGVPWGQNTLAGVIYGLSAAGLYSGTKAVVSKATDKIEVNQISVDNVEVKKVDK